MTTIGKVIPVRAKTLSRIAQKRASRPVRSPASTQCLDILCPPPGTSEVVSHFERLRSNEMQMAQSCVWIGGGSSCGSSDIGSLQSESDRNLSLPHDRPLSTPHGIFAALAMTVELRNPLPQAGEGFCRPCLETGPALVQCPRRRRGRPD